MTKAILFLASLSELATKTKLFYDCAVTLDILCLEVIKEATALTNQHTE